MNGVFVHTLSTGSNDRLTTGADYHPSYSPDATNIAFFRQDSGVWTMNSDGTNQQLVQAFSGPECGVDWGIASDPIPEPTTICLMGLGLLGILGVILKQRHKLK